MVACAAVAAGCGSHEQPPSLRLPATEPGSAARDPGRVVLRFVQAARRGDDEGMWALLSGPTRASMGSSFVRFAYGAAPDLTKSLVDFHHGHVLLSRRLDERWAVGAIQGLFEPEGEKPEPGAYAAALRREGGTWKVELDGLVIGKVHPGQLAHAGPQPELGAEAQAGRTIERMLLWLDGAATSAGPTQTSPFSAELSGVPDTPLTEGPHAVVVFAATRHTAAALAWIFKVDG